ncbi:MAG: hypothetical protein VKJ02_10435 [Snowella sp.]|nr:hypothetical protein [Snowella sp.]
MGKKFVIWRSLIKESISLRLKRCPTGMLVAASLAPPAGIVGMAAEIRSHLTRAIQTRLRSRKINVTPLVDVSVLEPPDPNL